MSRKLATTIKDSAIPGKYKRVLEAYAAFANNDGTNIRPAQKQLGKKAGVSRYTVLRNTPDLIASGIMKHATSHTCKVDACNKGATHFTGRWGHWTLVYDIDISQLQNATNYLAAICDKVNVAKCRKVNVAKCNTTQALKETPAPLGKEQDSSALTSGSKKESKQLSLATTSLASPACAPASQESQNQNPSGFVSEEQNQSQKQNQPQTFQELVESDQFMSEASHLLFIISPNITDTMVREQLPLCSRILEFFANADEYRVQAAELVLKFNRAHRSGKYATKDDKKLYIRTAAQFLKALESDSASLMNDYSSHDFRHCETCQEAEVFDYKAFVREIRKEEQRKAEQKQREKREAADRAARRAEEERLAKLCPECRKNDPGKYTVYRGSGGGWVKVCDPCYDSRYEYQQKQTGMGFRIGADLLKPRPEYLEAKRKAEAEAIAKKMDEAECDVPICSECAQVTFHAKSCSKNPNRKHVSIAAAAMPTSYFDVVAEEK